MKICTQHLARDKPTQFHQIKIEPNRPLAILPSVPPPQSSNYRLLSKRHTEVQEGRGEARRARYRWGSESEDNRVS